MTAVKKLVENFLKSHKSVIIAGLVGAVLGLALAHLL